MLWWSPSTLRFAAPFARVIPTSRRKGIFSIILNNPGLPQASVPQQVVPRLSGATCRAISSSPALLSALLPTPRLVLRGASAGGGFPGEVAQELGHGGWTAVGKQRGSDRASGVSKSGVSTEAAGSCLRSCPRRGKGPQRHFPSAPTSLSSSKRFPRLPYQEAPGQTEDRAPGGTDRRVGQGPGISPWRVAL